MRIPIPTLVVLAALAWLGSGCAKPEEKFGRGLRNLTEVARLGELRRTVEQTTLFESPERGLTTGFFRGLNRTLARTGVGLYEVVTFPFPPYDPVCTDYLTAEPVYPDSYRPGFMADSVTATDTYLGFSGGDIAPMVPGSRFKVFDN